MSSEQGPAAEVPHVGDGAAALEEPDSDQEFLDYTCLRTKQVHGCELHSTFLLVVYPRVEMLSGILNDWLQMKQPSGYSLASEMRRSRVFCSKI